MSDLRETVAGTLDLIADWLPPEQAEDLRSTALQVRNDDGYLSCPLCQHDCHQDPSSPCPLAPSRVALDAARLAGLPVGSVVLDRREDAWQRGNDGWTYTFDGTVVVDSERLVDWGPLTLIHRAAAEAGQAFAEAYRDYRQASPGEPSDRAAAGGWCVGPTDEQRRAQHLAWSEMVKHVRPRC